MYRPLQPASASPSETGQTLDRRPPNRNFKRRLIPVNTTGACDACKKRRCRCDGGRPACSACLDKLGPDTQCIYENPEGLPRSAFLKRKVEQLQQEGESLRSIVKGIASSSRDGAEVLRIIESTEGLHGDLVDEVKGLLGAQEGVTSSSEAQRSGRSTSPNYSASVASSDTPTEDDVLSQSWPRLAELRWNEPPSTRPQSQDSPMLAANQDLHTLAGYMSDSATDVRMSTTAVPGTHGQQSAQKRKREQSVVHDEGHLHLYAHLPMSSSIRTNGYPTSVQERQILNFQVPVYMIQPLTIPSDSPLCRVISVFREGARTRITQGQPLDDILGPARFDVSRVLKGVGDPQDFSVPGFAINLMKTFPAYDITIRLASVLLLTRFMRWQIAPTRDNYALIPDYMKPTPAQRLIPHTSEIDYVIIRAIREALILNPRDYRDYSPALEAGVSCDWPAEAPMVELDPVTKGWRLTLDFEEHVGRDDGFSLGPAILLTFPELEGKVRIQDKKHQAKLSDVPADGMTLY